jgi:hypothetical protein
MTHHVREFEEVALSNHLRGVHAPWLQVVRNVLKAARTAGAGASAKWSAICYLNTIFSARFEQERALIESLQQKLDCRQRTRLWAAAELIAVLRWQLDHFVGVCHDATAFATLTLKLDGALEHWCREVEATLGPLTWSELPEESRQLLRSIADDRWINTC